MRTPRPGPRRSAGRRGWWWRAGRGWPGGARRPVERRPRPARHPVDDDRHAGEPRGAQAGADGERRAPSDPDVETEHARDRQRPSVLQGASAPTHHERDTPMASCRTNRRCASICTSSRCRTCTPWPPARHAPQAWRPARRFLGRGHSASPRTAPARPGPNRAARAGDAGAALSLITASGAAAQTQAGWRYWAPADGIQESHSRKIGSLPGGGVTIRHGLVKSVDVLDGYVVETIAEPRVSGETDAFMASVHAVAGGDAWAVAEGVLKQLRGGQWIVRATPRPGEEMRSAIPISAGPCRRAVRLAHRRLRPGPLDVDHADRRRRQRPRRLPRDDARLLRRALDRRRARPRSPRRRHLPALDGLPGRTAWPTSRSRCPATDGELFAAAIDARTRHKVAVRLAGGRYQRVFDSTKALRAWRGPARLGVGARRHADLAPERRPAGGRGPARAAVRPRLRRRHRARRRLLDRVHDRPRPLRPAAVADARRDQGPRSTGAQRRRGRAGPPVVRGDGGAARARRRHLARPPAAAGHADGARTSRRRWRSCPTGGWR